MSVDFLLHSYGPAANLIIIISIKHILKAAPYAVTLRFWHSILFALSLTPGVSSNFGDSSQGKAARRSGLDTHISSSYGSRPLSHCSGGIIDPNFLSNKLLAF